MSSSYLDVISQKNSEQLTRLYQAAGDGRTADVEALLDAKADVDERDGDSDQTPLHQAAKGGHTAVVRALINARASIDLTDGANCTAILLAAEGGHAASIQALMDAKATVDVKGGDDKVIPTLCRSSSTQRLPLTSSMVIAKLHSIALRGKAITL